MKGLTNTRLVVLVVFILILTILVKLNSGKGPEPFEKQDPNEIIIKPINQDLEIKMYDHRKGQLVTMALEDYLVGVIAGEMPASYELEALKAQAVAARTRTISQMKSFGGRGCDKAQGADICSSYAHCQEWVSKETMEKNWASDYEKYLSRVQEAVYSTRGEVMTYQGEPIEVFYYSTSYGKTEDAGEVFSHSLPYYQVVESTGEEDAPRFYDSVSFSNKEFAKIFEENYKTKLDPNKLASQVKIRSYTESGRVKTISLAGVTLKSTDFRMMYGLNSTDFTLEFGKDSVTIKTKGFGHGVGMSQVGADRMAKRGSDYKQILKHYYRGVSIGSYQ